MLPSASGEKGIPGCITAGLDHLLCVSTVEKNEFTLRGITRAANHPITCMVAQPARSMLLTGGWDGTARLWAFDMQGAKGEPQRIAFREVLHVHGSHRRRSAPWRCRWCSRSSPPPATTAPSASGAAR